MSAAKSIIQTRIFDRLRELEEIRREVDRRGEFGDMYPAADDVLDEAVAAIADEVETGQRAAAVVAQAKGATLSIDARGLVHTDAAGKVTELGNPVETDPYRYEGGLGAIVVDGHEWLWWDIGEGLRNALSDEEREALEREFAVHEVMES